ncbi:MAG: hypothetical protein V5A23_04210 [Halobacteriales archaeon]
MTEQNRPTEVDDAGADRQGGGEVATRPTGDHDPSPGPTPLAADAVAAVETAVPDDETPAARCDRCGRPFRSERALALHRGEVHDDLDPGEAAAYERAREAEHDDLFFFHIRAVIVLGVLYAVSVVLYMVVLGNNWI